MPWTTNYYHADALGSTRALTDDGEAVTDRYVYDAFGNQRQATGSTVNPFRYVGLVGYYYDEDSGDYYVRARYYNPRIIRWLSVDPIGLLIRELNFYEYVLNSPLYFFDPSGHDKCCVNSSTICATTTDAFWQTKVIAHPMDDKRKIKSHRLLGEHAAQFKFKDEDCGECKCKCCAIEQWIRGYYRITDPNGKVLVEGRSPLPGSGKPIDPKVFQQDSKRIKPKECIADLLDAPGIGVSDTVLDNDQYYQVDISLDFEIRVIDTCNDDKVIQKKEHTMKITGPFAKPVLTTTLPKCTTEFLKDIKWPGIPKQPEK